MGTCAIVMPVVPADAPPQLEYALRLRRDTMMSGSCERCGATPDVRPIEAGLDVPTVASFFPHKINCPAEDRNAGQMFREYWEWKGNQSLDDAFEATQAKTRERIAPLKANGTQMVGAEAEQVAQAIAEKLLPEHGPVATCGHLQADPMQIWNVQIAEGVWRCDECAMRHFERLQREGLWLGPIEEFTCDLCRRYISSELTPVVLRVDNLILRGGICTRCAGQYGADGDGSVK